VGDFSLHYAHWAWHYVLSINMYILLGKMNNSNTTHFW
jgi:hypothetical protein